jgi:hypothetical protein
MFDRPDRLLARLKAPALLVATMLVSWWLLEAALYRSGFYYRLAEPESNTGAVVTALMLLDREYRPDQRNVLVFGDSRVGEGFSSRLAGEAARDESLNFINVSVPGSTPRTWYYLLREIARRGYAFDAVLVGAIYQPRGFELIANWPLDPAHQAPLVGLADAREYPASFASDRMRERARHVVLMPALAMRRDTLGLLSAPLERWRKLRKFRPGFLQAVPQYSGRGETMPALRFDGKGQVRDWSIASASQRALAEGHLAELRAATDAGLIEANGAYWRRWFTALADLTATNNARLIVFPLPRGPYGEVQSPLTSDAVVPSAVAGRPTARALAPDLLLDLEQPQYFFDVLHLNAAGRERMSARLGEEVARVLAAESR